MRLNIFILLLLLTGSSYAQQPEVFCANVLPDGNVELSWLAPSQAVVGDAYKIFRNGIEVASVNHPTLNYIDVGANANLGSVAYYIILDGELPEVPSNTINTIHLELPPSTTGSTSIAELNWNLPFDIAPTNATIGVEFRIASDPELPWTVTVEDLSPETINFEEELFGYCDPVILEYRITYSYDGCSMNSQIASREFVDDLPPPVPENTIASVDPETNEIQITWDPVNVPDFLNYKISQNDPIDGTFSSTDLPQGSPSSHIVEGVSASDGSAVLGVIAKDICNLEQSFGDTVRTIFTQASFEDCGQTVQIAWSSYEGWPQGVSSYDVKATLLDTNSDTVFTTVTNFGENNFELEIEAPLRTDFRFYVQANLNDTTAVSTSNGVLISTDYPRIAEFYELVSVSTNLDNMVELSLRQDTLGEGTSYELFRSEDGDDFELIATLSPNEEQDTIRFLDSEARGDLRVYTYYVQAIDGCGFPIGESNRANSIFLELRSPQNNLENQLVWNDYLGWDAGVSTYQIWRSEESEQLMPFDSVLGATTDYIEDLNENLLADGRFCYRILAEENDGQNLCFSNIACITQEPLIWIPDAMVYGGFNDEFKPVLGFVDVDSYRMEIYNKWGERLFETRETEKGWDGTYQGSVVREDFYRYIITVDDGSSKPFIEEGRLFMIKKSN